MLPPAPDLFSTTTGMPDSACRRCCRIRASRSAEPPAANGTTMVTCRCGQRGCADAGDAMRTAAVARAAKMPRMQILRALHGFQMRVPALVEIIVGVAHGLGLAAPEHHLEI